MNIPNFITLARLFVVPIIVWLIIDNNERLAFCLTVAAAISDAIDGLIAKRYNCVTKLGTFLDPIADKVLLVCLFIVLGQQGYITSWVVILVVFRDLLIIGGALIFHTITHSLEMAPLKISKINTLAQFGFVVGVLGTEGYGIDMHGALFILQYIIALTTILSGVVYVYLWSHKVSEFEAQGENNNQRGRK